MTGQVQPFRHPLSPSARTEPCHHGCRAVASVIPPLDPQVMDDLERARQPIIAQAMHGMADGR